MENEKRYFNFPIQMLEGFMTSHINILTDIIHYALYEKSLGLEYGDDYERIQSSADYFGVNLNNVSICHKNGMALYDSIDCSVFVGINKDVLFDYYKNEKTPFEKVCLLGYLAIKSILQNKPYCKITNLYWLSRMDGKVKAVNEVYELSTQISLYNSHYQTRKIKAALEREWFLKEYSSYTRGFYVSFNLSMEKLVFEVEKRKKSVKDRAKKNEKAEAKKKALAMLNQ